MKEESRLLQTAASEIRSLRKHNEIMMARLEMFDTMTQLLHSQPAQQNTQGFSPDIVSQIDRYLEEKENTTKDSPT